MSKEMVIGSNRHETKVAILEEDQLVEIYFQRANEYSLAGSIHKGRVTRVLPGMQSAFVDLGLERDTFLYVSDFFEEHEDIDTVDEAKPARGERGDRGGLERGDRGGRDRGDRRSADRNQGDRRPVDARSVTAPAVTAPIVIRTAESIDEAEAGLPPELLHAQDADLPFEDEIGGVEDEGVASETVETPIVSARSESPAARPDDRHRDSEGDQRHRRGRRRRNRGRGFPDNKYAQPGDNAGTESAPRTDPSRMESRNDRRDGNRGTAATPVPREARYDSRYYEPAETIPLATDVIVLPGESLAKYRNAASEPRVADVPPAPVSAPVVEPMFEDQAAAAERLGTSDEQSIEAEAEELALADRVFAHSEPSEATVAEEQEEHTEPEAYENPEATFAAPFEPAAQVESVVTLENAEPLTTFEVNNAPFLSRPEAHSPDAAEAEAMAQQAEIEELAEELEARLDGQTDEQLDGQEGAETNGEATGPQSAVLREGRDNRPLQRSSRRMRRRRGGSGRFSGGQQSSQEGSAAPIPGAGAAGAAPALESVEIQQQPERASERERGERPERSERVLPSISDLLKAGQEIIVQIAKEPLGQKGARITSHIALPGRYVVFMPSVAHLGVSRKIASDEERQRLKRILQAHRSGASGGFIVRTAGEGVPEDEIAADMNFLYSQWLDIRQKAEKKPAPALLHYDLDIVQRILRDHVSDDFKAIWVDSEDMYENILTFMQRFQPALVNRVKMYTRSAPIFDAFNITAELEKALRPKVWLKSGGYIVINQTEALVAIDINTGKYVGKSNRLEDTIVKTNTEAVKEIVRQIRLRDLGGIIVVDFIDMDERKNRQKVMQALEEAMRADKAPYKILQFNDFGLVAITRKRVKQSLERTLCSPCHYCDGAGYVKSTQTVIGEILVEAQKLSKAIEGKDVMLRVHPEVAKVLKASNNRYLEELEDLLGRPVLVKSDPTLHSEKFDLA